MMRLNHYVSVVALALFPYLAPAAPTLVVPKVTVGYHLQATSSIRVSEAAPDEGLELTLTSDDPGRLLLSNAWDKAGSPNITVKIRPRGVESQEFWLQGLAASGEVSYTIATGKLGTAKGTVTLTPSAIVIVGPHRAPKFNTTPHGVACRITIVSAALESSGKVMGEQPVAGGAPVDVTIGNSNAKVGKLGTAKLTLAPGTSTETTSFEPSGEGETVIAAVQPKGFVVPAEMASVTMEVAKPGMAITGDVFIGKDLQTQAPLVLGEPAPPGGLNVKLTSSDPTKLILAHKQDEVGSGSITVTIPAGESTSSYVIQGVADSGDVTYTAEAPGYRTVSAPIGLTKSGLIVAYEAYGPPEEGNVKRKIGSRVQHEFFASLAEAKLRPVRLIVWSAYIDREMGTSADFTVQPLRGGVKVTAELESSDPSVATIESPLTLLPGTNHIVTEFKPLKEGKTTISIKTPPGFGTPKNSTAVPAVISK